MPELKRRRRAASEPDADSADATQEYSPYVPTFQSARPEGDVCICNSTTA